MTGFSFLLFMICLVFGGLDLIFSGISFEPVNGFSSILHRYIIGASLKADLLLVTLT